MWETDEQYQLVGFWADKEHMKNCLKDSIYADERRKYVLYVDKFDEKYKQKILADLLKYWGKYPKAYDHLEIVLGRSDRYGEE